jgi:hypothetical protein
LLQRRARRGQRLPAHGRHRADDGRDAAGRVAAALIEVLAGRTVAATAAVKDWDADLRLRPWARAIRRRASGDWRQPPPADATPVELLAQARAPPVMTSSAIFPSKGGRFSRTMFSAVSSIGPASAFPSAVRANVPPAGSAVAAPTPVMANTAEFPAPRWPELSTIITGVVVEIVSSSATVGVRFSFIFLAE